MLPSELRLRSTPDFQAAVRHGVRAGRPTLVVHARANNDGARVGVVVSKAVGNAVVRNRVKRRLRALAATRATDLPAADVVVRALPAAATTTFDALGADFGSALGSVTRKLAVR